MMKYNSHNKGACLQMIEHQQSEGRNHKISDTIGLKRLGASKGSAESGGRGWKERVLYLTLN